MIEKANHNYQGQISSYNYPNFQLPQRQGLLNLSGQYIERIGIFAPPGSQFQLTQFGSDITIQIGNTFMYEAFNTNITQIEYLGTIELDNNEKSFLNPQNQYSLPITDPKRIVIDYIVKDTI